MVLFDYERAIKSAWTIPMYAITLMLLFPFTSVTNMESDHLVKAAILIVSSFSIFAVTYVCLMGWAWDNRACPSEPFFSVTPVKVSSWLSNHLGPDHEVKLKIEAFQESGSFKIRGISFFMKNVFRTQPTVSTFVTSSSANAGMAVAHAAQKLGCKCRVVLDEGQRNNSLIPTFTERYGAEVVFQGATWNEADEYAQEMCDKEGHMAYVPMFDDPHIFNGHSSMLDSKEMPEHPDCIVCAVGGGGLLMGVLGGLFQRSWINNTTVVAAQSERCALLQAAISNSYVSTAAQCVSADGVDLGHRAISPKVLKMVKNYDKVTPVKSLLVKDSDVLHTATEFALQEHVLIEPLCAVAVAAVLKNKEYFRQFKKIVVIVCGGNHVYFDREKLDRARETGEFNYADDSCVATQMHSASTKMREMSYDDELDSYDSDTEEM